MKTRFACFLMFLCLSVLYLSPAEASDENLARQLLAEINLSRSEPLRYAGFLREFRSRFQGTFYRMPGTITLMQTSEGVAAVDEAIRFLQRQKALPPLAWSEGLAAAAGELVREQGRSGSTGHGSAAGLGMRERIERQGSWQGRIGENIAYGPADPRGLVMQLLIDDGVPDRGHRKNQFSKSFGTAGVACGPHPRFGSMCVIDFAGSFRE
jgi:uncharacterized protein YkwD